MKRRLAMPSLNMDDVIERLGQIPDRKRRTIEAAVFAALLLAYFLLWAQPNVDALDDLNNSLAKASQQLAEKKAFTKHFDQFASELASNKARLAQAHELLPDNPDIPEFLAKLGAMASSLDIAIERLEPSSEVEHDFYAEIGLRVQVRGGFHQVATLIDQIGNEKRIVNVTNVTFAEPKAHEQKISVGGAFDVKLFRFLTDEQIAASQTKAAKP